MKKKKKRKTFIKKSNIFEKGKRTNYLTTPPPPNSGTCFFRCALTCIRYLGKKYGFSVNQRKQLMFSLRLAFIQRTRDDLLRFGGVGGVGGRGP